MRIERRALPLVLAASLFGCGGDPVSPPTAVASPSPVPSPTPTATPTPPPLAGSCSLPPMPECAAKEGPAGVFGCCKEISASLYEDRVAQAIRAVQKDNPAMFDGDRLIGDDELYVELVAKRVTAMFSLCTTVGGPADEIGVKAENNLSEQFDILYASGQVNFYGHTVTCKPARF
jgi:hypothetical protein